jgi:uncharacterized protein (TIGR02270 family)
MKRFLDDVVAQHAEEAAFLWLLRDATVLAPHHALTQVAALDERIEAHLDGLRVAGDAGWETCAEELRHRGGGEAFAAGVMAFESASVDRIQPVLETATQPAMARGIASALAWVPLDVAEEPIRHLLASESPVLARVGIAAAACHRLDPGDALRRALESDRPALVERACRAAGELGRVDVVPLVRMRLQAEQPALRFAAAWAAGLLGDRSTVRVLGEIAAGSGPYALRACALGIRLLDEGQALTAHEELTARPDLARVAIVAASAAAYPSLVPWLLEQMDIPALARVAAEAFSMVTGLDLVEQDLATTAPDGFEAGPTDDPADDNVDLDPDEHLPWPLVDGIRDWWSDYRGDFHSNTRYLLGNPITPAWLDEVLRIGRQRQRAAAALELSLDAPGTPLFEVRAPGLKQRALLGEA